MDGRWSRLQCFFLVFKCIHVGLFPEPGFLCVYFSWHPNVQDDTKNMLQSLQLVSAPWHAWYWWVVYGRTHDELEALQIWLGFLAVFLTLNPSAVFWHRLLFHGGVQQEANEYMAMESQNLKCVVAYTSICCFTCIPSQPLSFSKETL